MEALFEQLRRLRLLDVYKRQSADWLIPEKGRGTRSSSAII